MTERVVKALLFDAELVNGTGSVTSERVPMKYAMRAEGLLVLATSPSGGTPDIKIEYAISDDGETFGSFDDYDDLVEASATDFATPGGITAVSLPNFIATYVKFKVTGVNSNPTDTLVTVKLLIREC